MSQQYRPVEKMALSDIDLIHTTPLNNIHNKPNVLFRLNKDKNGALYCHLPTIKNGLIAKSKFWFLVEKSDNWKLQWRCSIINTHTGEIHEKNNKRYTALGHNRLDAAKTMMGIPVVHNKHSFRNLNLLEICNPHFILPKRYNALPQNPVELNQVTSILFQWLNGEIT